MSCVEDIVKQKMFWKQEEHISYFNNEVKYKANYQKSIYGIIYVYIQLDFIQLIT
ncbi:MAG: hypothetical protein M5U17_16255 [Ignavibacterium sp.]|nr:hypothetical protein [Ignavibacterium sp.]